MLLKALGSEDFGGPPCRILRFLPSNRGKEHYVNDHGEITSVWFERRRRAKPAGHPTQNSWPEAQEKGSKPYILVLMAPANGGREDSGRRTECPRSRDYPRDAKSASQYTSPGAFQNCSVLTSSSFGGSAARVGCGMWRPHDMVIQRAIWSLHLRPSCSRPGPS